MISITESPVGVALSKNPNVYRLQATDNNGVPYGAKGATGYVETNSNGYISGDTLIFSYTNPDGETTNVSFAVILPANDYGELEAKTFQSPGTNLDYFKRVAAQIQGHPLVAPYFSAVATPENGFFRITCTALDTSAGWSCSFDASGVDAGSNAAVADTSPVADNTPDNYRVLFDVYVEQTQYGSDYLLAADLDSVPDTDGNVFFDISDILDKEITKIPGALNLPAYGSLIPNLANTTRRYYVRYREDYTTISNNPLNQDGVWQNTQPTTYLCGLDSDDTYTASLDANNSIITHNPNGRMLARQSPEYLNWYNWTGEEKTVIVQYEVSTDTGVTDTPNTVDRSVEMLTVPAFSVGTLPCGVQQLAISDLTAVKLRVRVIDHADSLIVESSDGINDFYKITPYSEWRTYYIDDCFHQEQNHLIYYDKFRLPHVVRCVGEVTQGLSVNRQVAQRIILNSTPDEVGETFQYDEDSLPTYIFRTGYLSKSEGIALQTALRVNELWKVGNARYLPLILTKSKFSVTETRRFLHAYDIEVISNENPTSLSEEIPPLTPLLTCEFVVTGEYANDTAAAAGGVPAEGYYSLSQTNDGAVARGVVIQLNPAVTYRNDAEALAGLPSGQRCYTLSQSNDYGMPRHAVKALTGYFETYENDTAAKDAPSLSTGDKYPLARRNTYGLTEALIKVITN